MVNEIDNKVITEPGKATPEPKTGGEGEKPEFISRNEFEQKIAEITETTRRQAQSYSMQAESRINKRIKDGLTSLNNSIKLQKDMGLEIPADKVEAMKQKIISDAYMTEDQDNPPASSPGKQVSQTMNQVGESIDPESQRIREETIAKARGMAEMAGFVIEPADPEMVELQQYNDVPPDEFLKAYRKALNDKTERIRTLGAAQQPNLVRGTSSSPDLMQEYKDKKSKLPRGNIKAHFELESEYRKKGLQI